MRSWSVSGNESAMTWLLTRRPADVNGRHMNVRLLCDTSHETRNAAFDCFEASSPNVVLFFGTLIGRREFSYNSGYGRAATGAKSKAIADWRIHPDDLETIRAMARKAGRKVSPCGKSPGRPKKPKLGPKPHPKQLNLFGSNR